MTTLKEIIDFLKEKGERELKCQPSMDGSREKYYQGKYDAFQDCVQMLKKYCEQSVDSKFFEQITNAEFKYNDSVIHHLEFPHTSSEIEMRCLGYHDGYVTGYLKAMRGE